MRSRRPLAPAVYLTRNGGKTVPLIAVIMLAVVLIAGIVAMIDSITYSIQVIYKYSSNFLAVNSRGDAKLVPALYHEVMQGAPVPIERVIYCRATSAQVKSLVGNWPFVVLGLKPDDAAYWLERIGSTHVDGRMPALGKPEIVVSDPVARNLHLKIGSVVLKPSSQENYSPHEVKVVGISNSPMWTMVADYTYIAENHFPPIDNLLFFAHDRAAQIKLDNWAFDHFKGERAALWAYREIDKQTRNMFKTLFAILNVVIGLLVVVITIMMAMLINIYLSQRLVEFGLLQALGYTKRQLLVRVFKESSIVVVVGWVLGVIIAYGLLVLVKHTLMDPNGYGIQVFDPVAFRYTLPIPIAILLVAGSTVYLRFRHFDPVGVVERRLV